MSAHTLAAYQLAKRATTEAGKETHSSSECGSTDVTGAVGFVLVMDLIMIFVRFLGLINLHSLRDYVISRPCAKGTSTRKSE